MKRISLVFAVLLPAIPVSQSFADLITQFNFNSLPSDNMTSTGTNRPSVGSGTASLIGGITATWATGSTNDPASISTGLVTQHWHAGFVTRLQELLWHLRVAEFLSV